MKTDTLSIPRHRDPLARAALLGLFALVAFLNIAQPDIASMHAQAPIIVLATPTLNRQIVVSPAATGEVAPRAAQRELPTPHQMAPTPEGQPGIEMAAPTIA